MYLCHEKILILICNNIVQLDIWNFHQDYSPGLRGVVAGETSISTVGKEGTSLRYRGYDATDLTKNNTYEQVASLIITDSLNDKDFKKSFAKYYLEISKDQKIK